MRLHAFIVLCLLTGVRSKEARALTWEHVDLDAGTISVWRSVRAHGDAKTVRSRRTQSNAALPRSTSIARSSMPHRGPPGVACRGDTGALLVKRYFST